MAEGQRKFFFIGAAVIILAVFAAYSQAIQGGFIWDDEMYVTENLLLRSVDGLYRIWFEIGAHPQYYPLVLSGFWAQYQLWGLDPLGYHIVNVVIFSLSAVLLWLLLRRLEVPGAYLAAVIFALHPVHVESVAWITELKNTASCFFYLCAFFCAMRFYGVGGFARKEGEAGKRKKKKKKIPEEESSGSPLCWYLMFLFFVFALLSKTVAATMPAAVLLVLWWKRGRLGWSEIWPVLPLFVLSIAFGSLTVGMEKETVGAQGAEWDYNIIERILIAGRALWFYAGKLVFPYEINFNYHRWDVSWTKAWQYIYPAAAFAVVAVLFFLRKRLGRGPLTGVLFFIGTLFPALGMFNVYPFRYSFVADHFQFWASIGLIVLIVAVGTRFFQGLGETGKKAGLALFVLIALVLGAKTYTVGHMYKDLDTLYNDILSKNPGSFLALTNLGVMAHDRGEYDKAIEYYERAIKYKPDHAEAFNNIGNSLMKMNRPEAAVEAIKKAIELEPKNPKFYNNLGNALNQQGLKFMAMEQYEKALELYPEYVHAYYNMGNALHSMKRFKESEKWFLSALERDPYHKQSWNMLGVLYAGRGMYRKAAEYFGKAVNIDPEFELARRNFARALEDAQKRGQ